MIVFIGIPEHVVRQCQEPRLFPRHPLFLQGVQQNGGVVAVFQMKREGCLGGFPRYIADVDLKRPGARRLTIGRTAECSCLVIELKPVGQHALRGEGARRPGPLIPPGCHILIHKRGFR